MDDLTKREADLVAEMWKQIARFERTMNTVRNALQHTGAGSSVTTVADVLVDEAKELLKLAAKSEGHSDAVRMM